MRRPPRSLRPDFAGMAISPRRGPAAVRGLVLLAFVLAVGLGAMATAGPAPAPADGHGAPGGGAQIVARSDTERALFQRLVCMCPTCARPRLADCGCGFAQKERTRISRMVIEQHMTEQQVVDALVAEYGEAVLGAPEKGVSGRAWLILYGLGGLAIVGVLLVAVRWTRRRRAPGAVAATVNSPVRDAAAAAAAERRYEEQLEDELREIE